MATYQSTYTTVRIANTLLFLFNGILQKCGREGLVVRASRGNQGGIYAVFRFAHPSPDQGFEETRSRFGMLIYKFLQSKSTLIGRVESSWLIWLLWTYSWYAVRLIYLIAYVLMCLQLHL